MVCKHNVLKLKLLHLLKSRLCFKHFKCKYPNNPNICVPKSSLGSLQGRVYHITLLRSESFIYRVSINSHFLLFAKDVFFGKQKFDVKQLKLNKFIFDVKQLKMNKFIKYILQLIISTSNATL